MERVVFLIESTGERIDSLLNPETVVFRREAGIRRRAIIGRLIGDSPWYDEALICGAGRTELQLDLLFDTSLVAPPTTVDNVQVLTAPFWALARHRENDKRQYEPNLVRFIWGKTWNVLGVVAEVAERFELFTPSGEPQRSWLRMRFLEVADRQRPGRGALQIEAAEIEPVVSAEGTPEGERPSFGEPAADLDVLGVVPQGRLDQLAFELTGSPSNWRQLAKTLGVDNPTVPIMSGVTVSESPSEQTPAQP
jgi:hypothetical protein